jgi:hypothetical protein
MNGLFIVMIATHADQMRVKMWPSMSVLPQVAECWSPIASAAYPVEIYAFTARVEAKSRCGICWQVR